MSDLTIFGIEEKIKQHKADMAKLEKELEKAKLESPDQQLAKELHGMLCTWNHTDGCGWFYEIKNKEDDWLGRTHGEYLKKAQKLICQCKDEGIRVETALSMFKTIRGL
jgi:hypothetical protein